MREKGGGRSERGWERGEGKGEKGEGEGRRERGKEGERRRRHDENLNPEGSMLRRPFPVGKTQVGDEELL